jgi:hypothetical protein
VSDQIYALATLPQGKVPLGTYQIEQVGRRSDMDAVEKRRREKSLALY